jgi:hypothetical protein
MEQKASADATIVHFPRFGSGLLLGVSDVRSTSVPLPIDARSVRLISTVGCFYSFNDPGNTVALRNDWSFPYLPEKTVEYVLVPYPGATMSVIWANEEIAGDFQITPCI